MAETVRGVEHGTPSGYSYGGCRCADCRRAMTDYQRAWRFQRGVSQRSGFPPVCCSACRLPIEGCDGRHGDWMHSATRSEFCADGSTLAEPERPGQIVSAAQRGRARRLAS